MTLINDQQSGQAQQILMRFYEELLRVQPATIDLKRKPEEAEETEETEEKKKKDSLIQKNDLKLPEEKPPHENISIPPNIEFEIYQNSQLIYQAKAQRNQGQAPEENPRLFGQIEVLQSLPVGTETNIKNLQIKVNKKTVLAIDEQGKITNNILRPAQEKTISGTEIISQQLAQLNNKLEKAQSEIAYLKNIIETQPQKTLNPTLAETVQARQEKPQEPKWWLTYPLGQQIRQQWQAQHQPRQTARTIHWLFQKNVPKGGQVYQMQDYTILYQPQGNRDSYSLRDKQNNELLSFNLDLKGNLSIDKNNLSRNDDRAIREMRRADRQAETVRTEANPRSQQLAGQLQQMAQQQGTSVRRSGQHYNLAVDAEGNIEIAARDGRGVIFQQIAQGGQHYVMSDRLTAQDLNFFEKQLQSSQGQKPATVEQVLPRGRQR